ncbi:hypothetical protein K1719_037857 [Acacia pycnantha]|nr:hypothetical protein K1719_037857 [Acacia pycnantha]
MCTFCHFAVGGCAQHQQRDTKEGIGSSFKGHVKPNGVYQPNPMAKETYEPNPISTQTEQHLASTADVNGPFLAVGVQNSAARGNSEPSGSEVGLKKKRGRPRKNDENLPSPNSAPPGFPTSPSSKRGRGRPRGSGKLQMLASMGGIFSATAGGGFIPHVLTVNPGEDVVKSITSFSPKGHRALCILSAIGAVNVVEILLPDSCGRRCVRYEGVFEIINLSGSYTYSDKNQTNLAMKILLAKPDGMIFGGTIGGSLIAARPIQLILGSFKQKINSDIRRLLPPGESSDVANDAPGNSDAAGLSLQIPRLIESEHGFPSPTSGLMLTSNGLADHSMPRTSNGFPNNVTATTTNDNGLAVFFPQSQSMPSLNGSSLDCHVLQPFADPMTFGDINNSVSHM